MVVIDDGAIGSGMTSATTAHLANALDDRYFEIERLHGERGSRLAAASHTAAIDRIESIVKRERIACDFKRVDGYLFCAPEHGEELLDRELAAAHRAQLHEVTKLPRAPLAFDTGPCLRFPQQGQFHPLKYLAGVAEAIERAGGRIYTGTHATKIAGGKNASVSTKGGTVRASDIVVATNAPVNDLVVVHTKQAPYMTYVIAAPVARGSVTRALYWDTADPHHYIRLHSIDGQTDLLIVGGEDHKSGQADDIAARHPRLEVWARERFPAMGPVAFTWAGQVMETVDGLAFIGRNPMDHDNVYMVTGDSGMGMTHGTIAGLIITDLISGRHNPWASLYDPSRVTLRAARCASSREHGGSVQINGGDVGSRTDRKRQRRVIRHGVTKVAVYRDPTGLLHERSAVCPHLGCIVAWNAARRHGIARATARGSTNSAR